VFLSGRALNEQNERGQIVIDSDFLLLVNAYHERVDFDIPMQPADARWVLRLDTADPAGFDLKIRVLRPGDVYVVQGRALALFEYPLPPEDGL
jgi:isoamylase